MLTYFEKTELEKYFSIDIIFNFNKKNKLNVVGFDLKNRNIELNLNTEYYDNDYYEIDIAEFSNIVKNKLI